MTKKLPPDELAARRTTAKPRGLKPGQRPGSAIGPASGAKAILAAKRQADALSLRLSGANLSQIAETLGYASAKGAHEAIMSALRTTLPEATREQHRNLELARLDRLELAHWQPALSGDDKSARVVLQCIGLRAKLLGLEAPAQVAVSLFEGDVVEISVMQLLSDEQLKAALQMRNEVMELSRMRAGAIDAEPNGHP